MTSETREGSWSDGQPVAFFKFVRGAVDWRYTSGQLDQTLNGEPYTCAAIWRSAIRQGSERGRQSITMTLPSSLPVADNWRPYPPADPINLTVFVRHAGETDAIAEWVGRVVSPKFNGSTLELSCEPTQTRSRRRGIQRVWQRGCGVPLYSQGVGLCNVDRQPLAMPATLSAVSGLSLSAAAFATLPTGRLAGGYLEWTRPDGLVEFRSIRAHAGDTVTVDYGALELAAGLAVTAYPGCAHTWADCGYFGNQDNYAGDPNIPLKSPNDGTPVW